jgi:gamma-glutamylcyclotransferase (GGCT)/AIG2-like uncharacterized protein YtfP
MTQKFFVYGSYCSGFCQFKKISNFAVAREPAQIRATAYSDQFGYPLVFNDGVDLIEGELLELDLSHVQVAFLDEMMGYNPLNPEQSLFVRQEAQVTTAECSSEKAWVYFTQPQHWPLSGAHKIEQGDWKGYLQQKPALPETLSERQKTYILKLGSVASRDVVRIDLNLYRELMNLELIIDKGRRLALTKKGQDIYRFIR